MEAAWCSPTYGKLRYNFEKPECHVKHRVVCPVVNANHGISHMMWPKHLLKAHGDTSPDLKRELQVANFP